MSKKHVKLIAVWHHETGEIRCGLDDSVLTRIVNLTLPQTKAAISGFEDTKVSTTEEKFCTACSRLYNLMATLRPLLSRFI